MSHCLKIVSAATIAVVACCITFTEGGTTPPQLGPNQGLYQPVEKDFRNAYDEDSANAKKQSWKEYWTWVQTFYQGNLFDAGWLRRSESLLASIKDAKERDKVRDALNSLGRQLAAEWSKDVTVRRNASCRL